MYVVVLAF